MAIVFNCPACGKSISAPEAGAGKRGKCPGCGGSIQVPAAANSPPEDEVFDADVVEEGPDPYDRRAEKQKRVADAFAEFSKSKQKPADEEDYEEDRPSRRRPISYEDEDEAAEPPRRRRQAAYEDEDDYEDRPRRRGGRRGSSGENGMTYGILAIVFALCCPLAGLIIGAVGISKANNSDDPAAGTAKVLCIVGICLSIVNSIAGVMLNMQGRFN